MTLIKLKSGKIYDLLDYGIRTMDVLITSPEPQHNLGEVEGSNGVIDYGTTYGARKITCLYRAQSHDIEDFSLLRNEIFNIFRTEESFYLIEKRLRGIQWLVKAGSFKIPQRNIFGRFEVDFIGLTGFAESIGTTQDIQRNGLTYSAELWSYGMGLQYEDDTHKYTHETPSFSIFNAGNVPIHPFEQDLKIAISGATGSDVTLKNTTTGDEFKYTESPNGKVIVLNGANITANDLQALRDTNKQFITLAPGENKFTVTSGAKVEFDFRFYYL